MSVVIVSVEALRRQDADAARDIAAVLQKGVGDPLDIEIENVSDLIAALGTPETSSAPGKHPLGAAGSRTSWTR